MTKFQFIKKIIDAVKKYNVVHAEKRLKKRKYATGKLKTVNRVSENFLSMAKYSISREQAKLTPLELAKDVEMKRALAILKQLDPEVDIQWVKAGTKAPSLPASRKIIQMNG